MVGIDRLSFNSWELVVVGSFRSAEADDLDASSRLRGVDGYDGIILEGVDGPAMLLIEDCAECPILDPGRRLRLKIGPPLSDTGAKEDGTRS